VDTYNEANREGIETEVVMDVTETPSPTDAIDALDPGDETQRNFRYQHAYGVVLLIAAISGAKPYVAIWCEQHEDCLCERSDGKYDGYQIKTQKPEDGPWRLSSEPLCKSIGRFVRLNSSYSDRIASLFFVSNTDHFVTTSLRDIHNSLPCLLDQVVNVDSPWMLAPPFDKAFATLKQRCSCGDEALWDALRKVGIIKGPDRNDFDAVIAHEHVSSLPGCDILPPSSLNALRDELVSIVYRASSLQVEDPSRHYYCLRDGGKDPRILKKRIPVDSIMSIITDYRPIPFRYLPVDAPLDISAVSNQPSVLEKKLIRGGLVEQVETMRRRALSAENHLMELAYKNPEAMNELLSQVVSVVKGECDEALLNAQLGGNPFGRRMLNDVYHRLRVIAENRPHSVHDLEYDCLAGITGMLTAECQVWWSDHFDLEDA